MLIAFPKSSNPPVEGEVIGEGITLSSVSPTKDSWTFSEGGGRTSVRVLDLAPEPVIEICEKNEFELKIVLVKLSSGVIVEAFAFVQRTGSETS